MSLFEHERAGNAQEIIQTLHDSQSEEVRKRAAEVLGRMDDHEDRGDIITALVRAVQEDESDAVIAAAIDALDELGQEALEELITSMADLDIGEDAADWMKAKAFVRALGAELPELRMAAANAIGELEVPDTVPKLVERFEDPDPRVRARAARACRQIGDARATEPLTGLLTDPKAAVRVEAAEGLGRIGNRQALQALLQLYDDEDERVRRIAVRGFGQFRNDRPVEYLAEALTDESAPVRRTAVFSLIELLSNVPTEQSHQIRETVVEQLSESEDNSVIDPLVEILNAGTKSAQRRNTAWLLGRVMESDENREAIDALIDTLEDGGKMTKQFAATSLAEIGGTYTEEELLGVARDENQDSDARAQAVFTLGKIGDEDTAEDIERLLDSTEDEQVRQRAFSALSKLGGHAQPGQG
ncbi:HEAT repeat domain-containing protein [Halovenus sp. WSH3]|uniref:HEAT repeat domain-containing protein n=1 Tax=Halovenus carboxidivorans TaxID=2692199 RepID=A0A6B0T6R8_9EURY|nr:HEAT repeat domain-containing protein [Halovenus carboxidivorans]MXR52627.1 HEAT repeat domain-containing protein [Halovenus carboxidivorans]